MQQISPSELKAQLTTDTELLLIDVREPWEHEAYNIGGLLIPVSKMMARINEVPKDKEVVIYCEKGIRSVIVIQRLENMGYTNLINLSGGMKAWKEM